jgi:hypothetical protein
MKNELMRQIDCLMAKAWDDLEKAAKTKDSASLNPLNGRMAELGKMKKDLLGIITRIQEMSTPSQNGPGKTASGLRKIRIKVTQGMINQNLLTLTEALRNGIVRTQESFSIETFPNQRKFTTFLERVGNKLQERSSIGAFYRDAGVQAGDIVEMTEVTSGNWHLKAVKESEGVS